MFARESQALMKQMQASGGLGGLGGEGGDFGAGGEFGDAPEEEEEEEEGDDEGVSLKFAQSLLSRCLIADPACCRVGQPPPLEEA